MSQEEFQGLKASAIEKKSVRLVKASVYMFNVDKKGNEYIPNRCMVGGNEIAEPEELFFAKSGEYPNYDRVVTLSDAFAQTGKWLLLSLNGMFLRGQRLSIVSIKEHCGRYGKLASGDVVYEAIYNKEYKNAEGCYTADDATRIKIQFVKA